MIAFQVLMMIGHSDVPILVALSSWKISAASFLCTNGGLVVASGGGSFERCLNEWQKWLSISMMPRSYVIMDFILLIATVVARVILISS